MAKRRRLTPAQMDYLTPMPAPETKSLLRGGLSVNPPIAQVAGDVSATSALQEVAEVLASARAEGRLIQRLPLAAVDLDFLVRDRIAMDEDELGQLMTSLRSHGQRSPIEVTVLPSGRYGLISGWRRMQALARLQAETQDPRFGQVLAVLRKPEAASDAYVSMVEENEVRVGLSYYERARIAARAVELGVFATEKQALQTLFASASRAKRSKIGSFLTIYAALDGTLRFPSAISERLGLAVTKWIEACPEEVAAFCETQAQSAPTTAAEELARLNDAAGLVEPGAPPGPAKTPPPRSDAQASPASSVNNPDSPPVAEEVRPGVFLKMAGERTQPKIILYGPNVGGEFKAEMLKWLRLG